MGSSELSRRANWQGISGALALDIERLFLTALRSGLDGAYPNVFEVEHHPSDFKDIYSTFPLPPETLSKIHDVDVTILNARGTPKYSWGISLDFAVRNLDNGKVLYGEIKRQDGWVESTEPKAGRGNAHERSCKYFTPGLMKVLRSKSNIGHEILPFWLVIVGDITRDPRRNREIAFWFQGYESNYFMWRDTSDVGQMLDFFENNLLPHLL